MRRLCRQFGWCAGAAVWYWAEAGKRPVASRRKIDFAGVRPCDVRGAGKVRRLRSRTSWFRLRQSELRRILALDRESASLVMESQRVTARRGVARPGRLAAHVSSIFQSWSSRPWQAIPACRVPKTLGRQIRTWGPTVRPVGKELRSSPSPNAAQRPPTTTARNPAQCRSAGGRRDRGPTHSTGTAARSQRPSAKKTASKPQEGLVKGDEPAVGSTRWQTATGGRSAVGRRNAARTETLSGASRRTTFCSSTRSPVGWSAWLYMPYC